MTSDRGPTEAAELQLNNTPVPPKLQPGLNPNATVFSLHRASVPSEGPTTDNHHWDVQNDSGIGIGGSVNSVSDYSFANGDVSVDKNDTGVFSPGSESPFPQEFPPFPTDNQNYIEISSIADKVEDSMGNLVIDNVVSVDGYLVDTHKMVYLSEMVPMQGVQYTSENGGLQDGDMSLSEGSLTEDQRRMIIKSQLESYFSRENLSNDSYLQSQMDADQYVPIVTVANLDQIQKLTSDLPLIVELLRESTFVQVDEKGEKVRPNHNRCIVILREIPDSTPVEDVQNLFSGQNCPKFVSCEFAHNSNWYVTFETDADAQRAYQYLREEVQTFLGKPIMARIKAKPLIRNYRQQNGFVNKRFQTSAHLPGPVSGEVITSSTVTQSYTATPPFTLMPNVSQYMNGTPSLPPFFPPHSPIFQTLSTTLLDPSMVLAMNGYQATGVKVPSSVPSRNMYNNISNNRNNTNRNQKNTGNNHSMGRDRINSNDSLPPRLQHQQERQQQSAANGTHGAAHSSHMAHQHGAHSSGQQHAPHHLKSGHPISNHGAAPYGGAGRRDGSIPHSAGHGSHGNHGNHGSHHQNGPHSQHGVHSNHQMHNQGGMLSSHQHSHLQSGGQQQQHHQQHLDGNNNTSNNSSSTNSRMPSSSTTAAAQRGPDNYSGKNYRRRKREEDGARPNRSNSSQSQRDGAPQPHGRQMSVEKFDYEPTSFPPLPGVESNTASGEVFESKLSDVVKGTARPQTRDVPKSSISPSSAAATSVPTATTTTTSSALTKPVPSVKEAVIAPSVAATVATQTPQSVASSAQTMPASSQSSSSQTNAAAGSALATASTSSSSGATQSSVSQSHRSSKSGHHHQQQQQQQQQQHADHKASPELQLSQSNPEDKGNSARPSYAQMVQKPKMAEVSANSLAEDNENSDSEEVTESGVPLAAVNRALKEQGQHPNQSINASSKQTSRAGPAKKDSNNVDIDSRRESNPRKDGYRQEDPREQRMNRRLKENRERRFGDRNRVDRSDRRERDWQPMREKEVPRAAVAK